MSDRIIRGQSIHCPYCKSVIDNDTSDLYMLQGEEMELYCPACGKEFIVECEITVEFRIRKKEGE